MHFWNDALHMLWQSEHIAGWLENYTRGLMKRSQLLICLKGGFRHVLTYKQDICINKPL
jgi:hypothetical protein